MKGPFKPVTFHDFNLFKLKTVFASLSALLQTAYLIIPPGLGLFGHFVTAFELPLLCIYCGVPLGQPWADGCCFLCANKNRPKIGRLLQ